MPSKYTASTKSKIDKSKSKKETKTKKKSIDTKTKKKKDICEKDEQGYYKNRIQCYLSEIDRYAIKDVLTGKVLRVKKTKGLAKNIKVEK